ncbi:hypothetical protein ACOTTU_04695 [Roseobacter sp. EG26]|uniref:hypothetical protein n=1 Tax=Roseobacter sp. EG26 TaxID=3412477 RepID=UPI00261A4A28|nr:hypothetical protein [uncultured Roseobacter sp.]
MATANFQARLDRINKAHRGFAPARDKLPIRSLRSQPIPRSVKTAGRKRFALFDHSLAMAMGSMLGCLAAVLLTGLTSENSPWGPGTEWNELVFLPALGGLALAPVLMLASLFLASRKPGLALFSLSYLTGLVVAFSL